MAANVTTVASSDDTPLPSTPPNTPPPLNNDTPIKITSSTVLPFKTHSKYHVDSYCTLGLEVKSFLVGPMPIDIFLNTFLPTTQASHFPCAATKKVTQIGTNIYFNTTTRANKREAYEPFVCTSHFVYSPN